MYLIKCGTYSIYDPRDEDYIVTSAKCILEANTVGEASFTMPPTHPNYGALRKLRSVVEIQQDNDVIFRGRVIEDSRDFYNQQTVTLEGMLGCTNDTIIPPFNFPEDCADAVTAEDIVKCFLGWILDQHNQYAQTWQELKLGNVIGFTTTSLPRSSDRYTTTWEALKTHLFESDLGGYLVVRYEADGNYVDYYAQFTDINSQSIVFGENLLDILTTNDTDGMYTAVFPLGGEVEVGKDADGNPITETVTLTSMGYLVPSDGIEVNRGYVYHPQNVAQYGWICAPISETTWDTVVNQGTLLKKATTLLSKAGLFSTTTIKGVDLSFTDDEIESFRVYKKIWVDSPTHDISNVRYMLTRLEIDLLNPQNTMITVGDTKKGLSEHTNSTARQVQVVQNTISSTNANKVGKNDNDQIVSMVNKATAVVNLMGNRLTVSSDKFMMDASGFIRSKEASFKGSTAEVTINEGVIKVNSPRIVTTEGWEKCLLMRFTIGSAVYGLYVNGYLDETTLEWVFASLVVEKIEM